MNQSRVGLEALKAAETVASGLKRNRPVMHSKAKLASRIPGTQARLFMARRQALTGEGG